ncbi:hypothetical protein AJ78_06652 [Emergomyces pasteurianus Ep9510]|uniref:Uncharacterized protein n=1 Tax=Emergomyces pasteurianus Ep9510 TaxID=1447872 RepID=A0A1J9PY43_9EURO|nr:hypothetical protein AJ78_06652 [Emergomyces pasteurianus Ep9510]
MSTSAFGRASAAPKQKNRLRNEKILHWLDNQDILDFANGSHIRTNAEIVIRTRRINGHADEYIHIHPPRSNLQVDFES